MDGSRRYVNCCECLAAEFRTVQPVPGSRSTFTIQGSLRLTFHDNAVARGINSSRCLTTANKRRAPRIHSSVLPAIFLAGNNFRASGYGAESS